MKVERKSKHVTCLHVKGALTCKNVKLVYAYSASQNVNVFHNFTTLSISLLISFLQQSGCGPSIWELSSCPNQPATCPSITSHHLSFDNYTNWTSSLISLSASAKTSICKPPLHLPAEMKSNVFCADVKATTFAAVSNGQPQRSRCLRKRTTKLLLNCIVCWRL